MSSEPKQPGRYVLGDAPYQRQDHATFETKPPAYFNGRWDSGAGYERWRSTEERPHTPTRGKEAVYVSHHRLLAVIACYPIDMPISEILDHMHGRDVHHNCPDIEENRGIPWDNRHDGLEVLGHGEHSSITQAEQRAWAEDAKQRALSDAQPPGSEGGERCRRCGDEDGPLATSDGFEGTRCLDCATEEANGKPISVGI